MGAAVGTATGRGIGVAFQLWILLSGRGRVVVRRQDLKLNVDVMLRLARVSASGVMQFLVSTASWLGLVRIIAVFGAAALAGYAFGERDGSYRLGAQALHEEDIHDAEQRLHGHLEDHGNRQEKYGATDGAFGEIPVGSGERLVDIPSPSASLFSQSCRHGGWLTPPPRWWDRIWALVNPTARTVRCGSRALTTMLFLAGMAIVFIAFAERLMGIFASDPEVLRYGTSYLRWVRYGYVFYAYGMVMVQAFNGAGDTVTPTVINLFCYWCWQIPLAYGLARMAALGPTGVFAAIAIAESTLAVVSMVVFRRGI